MNNKKKIAVFIDWFLPAYKAGGPITSVSNLVQALKNDFDFYIITSDRDLGDTEILDGIKTNIWQKKDDFEVIYLSPSKQNLKFIRQILKERKFDKIYINGIFSFRFSILPLIAAKKIYHHNDIIVAPRGMLSGQAFAKKSFKKKVFLGVVKLFGLFKDVCFQATTEQEFLDIQKTLEIKNIKSVQNIPRIPTDSDFSIRRKEKNKLKIVSIARISQEKNTFFALDVLSKITFGEIIFDIYGTIVDTHYWEMCKQQIDKMPKNIKVNYKGAISPDKISDIYKNYHFAFMPSVGENFGHSIFEAMSFGCPVIISDRTPWQNLEQKQLGWDISLDNEQKFVEVINYCLKMSQEEFNYLSQKVFNFAKDYIAKNNFIELSKTLFE